MVVDTFLKWHVRSRSASDALEGNVDSGIDTQLEEYRLSRGTTLPISVHNMSHDMHNCSFANASRKAWHEYELPIVDNSPIMSENVRCGHFECCNSIGLMMTRTNVVKRQQHLNQSNKNERSMLIWE